MTEPIAATLYWIHLSINKSDDIVVHIRSRFRWSSSQKWDLNPEHPEVMQLAFSCPHCIFFLLLILSSSVLRQAESSDATLISVIFVLFRLHYDFQRNTLHS